jgi:hypothetical protein
MCSLPATPFGDQSRRLRQLAMTLSKQLSLLLFMIVPASTFALDKERFVSLLSSEKVTERRQALAELEGFAGTADVDVLATTICSAIEKMRPTGTFEGPLEFSLLALGKLRAKQGIPTLLQYLTFIPTVSMVDEKRVTESYFPAVIALSQIGEPAVANLSALLQNPKSSDQEKHLAAWILMQVLGLEKAVKKVQESPVEMKFSNGRLIGEFLKTYRASFEYPDSSKDWTKF